MSDPSIAVLFPGQGSQTQEMRAAVERARPDLLERAAEVVGDDPFARIDDGTRFQQPAIFCASLVGWESLATHESPAMLAGHSLGEVTALVAAGALAEEDGLRLVAARGRFMEDAARVQPGGMLVVRAGRDAVTDVAGRCGTAVANDNSPRQVVLSGGDPELADTERALGERGIRTLRLPVTGAFHSPLMAPAVEPLRAVLAAMPFRAPRIPVLSGVTAAPLTDPRATLAAALTKPVRWVETLHALRAASIERFVETGPGRVLTGLVARTLPGVETWSLADEKEPVRG